MHVQMIRCGVWAGLSFLLTVTALNWLSRPVRAGGPAPEQDDLGDQVWQVLAEARRILEDSA